MTTDSETHQLLGKLTAEMESSRNQRRDLFDLLRSIGTHVTELKADMKHHMEKEDALQASHNNLEKRVNSLETIKSRIIGYGIGISMIGGAVSERISRVFGA